MSVEGYTASFLLFCKNNGYQPSDAMYHCWNHASYHRPAVIDREMAMGASLVDLLRARRHHGPPEPPPGEFLRGPVVRQTTPP